MSSAERNDRRELRRTDTTTSSLNFLCVVQCREAQLVKSDLYIKPYLLLVVDDGWIFSGF